MMGVALVKECIANGTAVIAIVRPNSKNLYRLPQNTLLQIVECDSKDIIQIADEISKEEVDCFYHFAWDGTAREQRNNVFVHEENIKHTLDAACVAKKLGCKAFVGAGSQAEYGRVNNKISPDTSANPEYAYGIAKLAAGRLCQQYCNQVGMRFSWGRIFSVYGEYDHEDTLIMYLIGQLTQRKDAELTACEQKWDYLYCADAARAFYLIGVSGTGIYCVGSGTMRPLYEYVEQIGQVLGAAPRLLKFAAKPYGTNQVMNLCADIGRLQADTGFNVQTDFKTGVGNTIEWYKKDKKNEKN